MPEETDLASLRSSSGGSSRTYVGVRRLTPVECSRLQGFPDDYCLIPVKRVKRERLKSPKRNADDVPRYVEIGGEVWQLAADGPRYRALGNSFAVPVIAYLGRRIQMVEDYRR